MFEMLSKVQYMFSIAFILSFGVPAVDITERLDKTGPGYWIADKTGWSWGISDELFQARLCGGQRLLVKLQQELSQDCCLFLFLWESAHKLVTKGSLSYLSSPCFSKNVLQSGLGLCIEFGPVSNDSVRRGGGTPSWTSTRVTCDCLLPFVHPLLSQVCRKNLDQVRRYIGDISDPVLTEGSCSLEITGGR